MRTCRIPAILQSGRELRSHYHGPARQNQSNHEPKNYIIERESLLRVVQLSPARTQPENTYCLSCWLFNCCLGFGSAYVGCGAHLQAKVTDQELQGSHESPPQANLMCEFQLQRLIHMFGESIFYWKMLIPRALQKIRCVILHNMICPWAKHVRIS